MTVECSEARLEAAQEDGMMAGLDLSNQGADCLFGHHEHSLRTAWHGGFAIGRTKLKAQTKGDFKAK
jgi:hypothetical protein